MKLRRFQLVVKMFELEIKIAGDLEKTIQAIGATDAQLRLAAMRAINKTALWIKSKSIKEISEKKKIQMKLIRSRE